MLCRVCLQDKPTSEFAFRNKSKGTRAGECKTCHNRYGKAWYQRNRAKQMAYVNARRRRLSEQIRLFLLDYLKSHPCRVCGIDNPVVLEFHHKNPQEKKYNIAHLIHRGCTLEVVKKEVEKCDVLCANCHRIETASEHTWYKNLG